MNPHVAKYWGREGRMWASRTLSFLPGSVSMGHCISQGVNDRAIVKRRRQTYAYV